MLAVAFVFGCGLLHSPPPMHRRAVLATTAAAAFSLAPPPLAARAVAAAPLTDSQMLTARQYLVDIAEARRGVEKLRPLLERQDEAGYESLRVELRKPPVFNLRKAVSKVLGALDDGPFKKARVAEYETMKRQLGLVDDLCRPDVPADKRKALGQELTLLGAAMDDFGAAFRTEQEPPAAAVAASSAPEAE